MCEGIQPCSTGAFRDSGAGAGAGLGNFWKRWVRVRQDSAIKKLLKIFLFNFLYIFTIKIFLTYSYALIHKKKKEEDKYRHFRPYSRPISAVSGKFRPYCPLADTTQNGRYGLILAELARFSSNRSRFGTNWAASVRIEPSRRESEKKKKT